MSSHVYFDPPLSVQRQQWLLKQLGSHTHDALVEIGCSEGSLLQCLLGPPMWLEASETWKRQFSSATGLTQHPLLESASVAPHRIVAVEIDEEAMSFLRGALVHQAATQKLEYPRGRPRWYDLQIELLLKSFVDLSAEQVKAPVDILVASEVVEHLDDGILQQFAPVVFGRLRPNVVLITTPNYDFNAHFDRSGRAQGYKDPTGRTERVFRHDDHKFEWTTSEWTAWCEEICTRYDYQVTLDGIGALQRNGRSTYDKDDGDGDDAFASHAAVFTRKAAAPPAELLDSWSRLSVQTEADSEEPFFKHTFKATPSDLHVSRPAIAEELQAQLARSAIDVYDVWMDEGWRVACAGKLETYLPDPTILTVHDGTAWLRRSP